MTPERYEQIADLFDQALEHAATERAAFLKEECGGDDELRAEVEKLLAHHVASGEFLARPALETAAKQLAHKQASGLIGQAIQHYQIQALLGTGGMGEVWLARDTRLERQVALKLLPPQYTQDAAHLQRFLREARAASALNHPSIVTIYEIGVSDHGHFIAMEFIEGSTLRQRLASGPLVLEEALAIVKQIAAALDTAHHAGIIHRDIKPENVMLRADGLVKVLDFGLARMAELPQPTDAGHPVEYHTDSGMVMGTPRYMSPEQARGQKVDARTDVFSLGVVFFEMLTGKPAFAGATAAEVFAALLEKDPPPLRQCMPEAPPELESVLLHTLAKERDERCASSRAFLDELAQAGLITLSSSEFQAARLSSLSRGSDTQGNRQETVKQPTWQRQTSPDVERQHIIKLTGLPGALTRHKLGAALALAGLLVVGASLLRWFAYWGKSSAPPAEARLAPFTTFDGTVNHPAFSPDGKQIAFVWDGGNGKNLDIYVKLIGAGTPLRLTTDTAEEISPAWSPDGRYVAFLRRTPNEDSIYLVPALGGPERKIGQVEASLRRQAWGQCRMSWSPDGKTFALVNRPSEKEPYSIYLLSAEDGAKRRLSNPPPESDDFFPAFSPDGQTLAFIRSNRINSEDLFLVSLQDGKEQELTADQRRVHSFAWTADSRELVFSSNRGGGYSLWRIGVAGGQPTRVAVTGLHAYSPAISRQGNSLAYNVTFVDSNIWELDRTAKRPNAPVKLISSTWQDHSPQFSPDGAKIVFNSDRSGSDDLWVCDSDGSRPTQLTFFDGPGGGTPRWSPDGQQIVFDARSTDNADIYVMSASGGKPRRIVEAPSHDVIPSWSRDGQCVYFCSNRTGAYEIWKVPAAGGTTVQVTKHGGFEAFESTDGQWLYYTKGRGPGGLWQMPVAGGEEHPIPELSEAGYLRYWAVLYDGIYFAAPVKDAHAELKFYSFATRRVIQIGVLERDPIGGPPGLTVSPDGRWVLYTQADQRISDIMLVENFH